MDVSNKRHGKKSDKETQSPVLKVFKDMMQRENNDPEKANLLKEKQENRKRRQYSSSRSKSDRVQRSCDSSSSEKHKRSIQYKAGVPEQKIRDYSQGRTQSIPFQGDKKESWWFWADSSKKKSEDTCSCVSCALKKIVNSEYTCIACLGVLFLISLVVVFTMLFRAVPVLPKGKPRTLGDKVALLRDGGKDRNLWDDTVSRHLSSLTGLRGNDFDEGFKETNNPDESGLRLDSELSGVLNTDSLSDGLSSERLRNFYKKLIQTDAQIRSLKKSVGDYSSTNLESKYYLDRSKRSLRLHRNSKPEIVKPKDKLAQIQRFNLYFPPFIAINASTPKPKKAKRFVNGTEEPTGFLIEKKQIMVQYKPKNNIRIVPKCSHVPKDSKYHEKERKHPFYKNTQRLDELLDQFLDKNLPDMMIDPFGVDVMFQRKDKFKTHNTNVKIETAKKPMKFQENRKEYKPKLTKEFFDLISSKGKKEKFSTTTVDPAYDVLLSVSTIVNPAVFKVTKLVSNNGIPRTPSLLNRVPNIRKLMQVEEDDELGYEDLKEVLADEGDMHDDTEKMPDRKKRMEDYPEPDPKVPEGPSKYNPPGVHNPNWKGPMPLYPDELSSMIHQAAMQNVNKVQIPVSTKGGSAKDDTSELDLTDTEYIESYSDDKFGKLVRMAQAYSDYGVLEGKKSPDRNENKVMDGKAERRVKMSPNKMDSLKNALWNKFKKRKISSGSEGIRIEFRPTSNSREDKRVELMDIIRKHVKVTKLSGEDRKPTMSPFGKGKAKSPNFEYNMFANINGRNLNVNNGAVNPKTEPGDYFNFDVAISLANGGGFTVPETSTRHDDDNGVIISFPKSNKKNPGSITEKIKTLFSSKNADPDESLFKFMKRSLKSYNFDEGNEETKMTDDDLTIYADNTNSNDNIKQKNTAEKINNEDSSEMKLEALKLEIPIADDSINLEFNISSSKDFVNNTHKQKRDTENSKNAGFFDGNVLTNLVKLNKNGSTPMDLSEFLMMVSNWFSLLADSDNHTEIPTLNQTILNTSTSVNKETINSTPKANASLNLEYPSYDTDMIQNIGHRSRVLLSLDDSNDSSTIFDVSETIGAINKDDVTSSSSEADTESNTITLGIPVTIPSSLDTQDTTAKPDNTPQSTDFQIAEKAKKAENKNITKRNALDDSNLIFWNDMYDDEYGIKLDPIDSAIRDKHNVKGMDFMKKSGNWIQDKVKNFANNFRGKEKVLDSNGKARMLRGTKYVGTNNLYPENYSSKTVKRTKRFDDDDRNEGLSSFSQLTAKMKEVCKQAAKEVQHSKNVKVRQEGKEDTMTNSLMQQLVRLMTDLVDFQVQQKTCVKLPPDLQDFLEWLTAPSADQADYEKSKIKYHDDISLDKPRDQLLELMTTPGEREDRLATRSDCLGTLHAVQDLMQQFDEMTDEDKSKMTGIREYLENQLQFLNKQLTAFDESIYKLPSTYEEENPSLRFRRDLTKTSDYQMRRKKQIRKLRRRLKRKFLKNFGKKHTRSTNSIYDGYPLTEINKFNTVENRNYGDAKRDLEDEKENKVEKRNLRDVYYKALNDAKKSTTVKNLQKIEPEGFDNAQIVRIEN